MFFTFFEGLTNRFICAMQSILYITNVYYAFFIHGLCIKMIKSLTKYGAQSPITLTKYTLSAISKNNQ